MIELKTVNDLCAFYGQFIAHFFSEFRFNGVHPFNDLLSLVLSNKNEMVHLLNILEKGIHSSNDSQFNEFRFDNGNNYISNSGWKGFPAVGDFTR